MHAQLKQSLAKEVATELRERVVNGQEGKALPGVRILARALSVSVPTICQALHLLEEEGLLEGGGTRRRWRMAARKSPPNAKESGNQLADASSKGIRSRRLLFLSPERLSTAHFSGVEIFSNLLDQLVTSDWEVMYRTLGFAEAKKPRRSWDELLKFTEPDALVVLAGTPVLAKWATERGIPTLFIGGETGGSGVPILAVRVSTMLRGAAGHLLALGHQRLWFPLCEKSPEFAIKCRKVAKEVTAAANVHPDSVTIATSRYSGPEIIVNLLHKQWQKEAADAVIFLDWREFVAAIGFFHEMGVRIPRDLSVILLSQNIAMEWHSPPITHYEHPAKTLARRTAKWVMKDQFTHKSYKVEEIKAHWNERESVIARGKPPVAR